MTMAIAEKIHSRAKAMGLRRSDIDPAINAESGFVDQPCSLCTKADLMQDHDGRRLRVMSEWVTVRACTNCGAPVHGDVQCSRCVAPR
jgi:hypothetical protein